MAFISVWIKPFSLFYQNFRCGYCIFVRILKGKIIKAFEIFYLIPEKFKDKHKMKSANVWKILILLELISINRCHRCQLYIFLPPAKLLSLLDLSVL